VGAGSDLPGVELVQEVWGAGGLHPTGLGTMSLHCCQTEAPSKVWPVSGRCWCLPDFRGLRVAVQYTTTTSREPVYPGRIGPGSGTGENQNFLGHLPDQQMLWKGPGKGWASHIPVRAAGPDPQQTAID